MRATRSAVPFAVICLLYAETARGSDSAWTLAPAVLAEQAIVEKAVFYDSDYDAHWVEEPEAVVRWFVRRGFAQKNVPELSAWLAEKVAQNQAIGTSVVFAMGVAPTPIVYPPYDDCLLARYVKAGGRVVWLANVPMYVAQGEMGPKMMVGETPREEMLGLFTDPETFYGAEGPTRTETGALWDLESVHSLTRPVINRGLSACFFRDPTNEHCGVGLVNLRPDAPLSGFIFVPDFVTPAKEGLLRNAYRLATWSGAPVAIPEAAALPDEMASFEAALRFGENDARTTFLRGELVHVYVRVHSRHATPLAASVLLTVKDGTQIIQQWTGSIDIPLDEADILLNHVNLGNLRRGTYQTSLTIAPGMSVSEEIDPLVAFGAGALTLTRDVRVAQPPDHEGTHVALWVTASPSARRTEHLLSWLAEHHLEPQFTDDYATGRDAASWYGMSFSVRRIGNSLDAPAPPGYDSWRRDVNGEIMPVSALGNRRVAMGYANPFRRQLEADDFGHQIAFDDQFPAFRRRAVTSDDYSQWFGMDYNRFAVEGFEARYGMAPPRPAELNVEGQIAPRAPGIIPDDDPWVLLNRYWCEDIHGDTARRLSLAMQDNTDGLGTVGQISGGMQIPVMQVQSAQYPPYFMGDRGYSLISFYYYSRLWQPPLAHIWWLEVARMGNRGREQWIMPDSGYEGNQASAIYDHFGWLMLAGGATGLEYFNYDAMTPGGIRAMTTFGGISKEYGRLLAELKPAPKKVALLVPFEQLVYKHSSAHELAYPFMDLLQAKVDVEPVSPDELNPTNIGRYEAILLAQTSWLKESTAELLAAYALGGGKVILDQPSGQVLNIPGAQKLAMRIGGVSIFDAGQEAQIAQTRQTLGSILTPPVDNDDPTITFRRFEAAGAPYLYVNHQMTAAEYATYRASDFQDDDLATRMGYGQQIVHTEIRRPNDGRIPFDLFAHQALPVEIKNGVMQFVVPIPKWHGRLVVFLPVMPDRLKITNAPKATAGIEVPVTVRVMGRGGDVQALFPLHVTVTDPHGQRSIEYSRQLLARQGAASFGLTFAQNDVKGLWTIAVRDAMTRLQSAATIELR